MTAKKLVMPFLKWAGGKRQLLEDITKYLPSEITTYHEPFVGAGAVLFHLLPKKAYINDSNKELINCYEVIRDYPEELIIDLQRHKNEPEYYYKIRDLDRDETYQNLTPVERASRIIYLNKTCFNGLFRVNSQGQFNVPFGKYKNPKIVNEIVIRSVHTYLKEHKVTITNGDFEDAVKSAKQGDFIYFDPPYDPVSDTASFTGYAVGGFNRDEQERLASVYDKYTAKGCKIMLSNSNTPFIRQLYSNYRIIPILASRNINSNAQKRGAVEEVLVINYDPPERG